MDEDAIVVRKDGISQHFKRFELRETELIIPEDVEVDEWVELGVLLMRKQITIQWLLGDWLVYGIDKGWEDGYSYIHERFGYEVESLWSYASVCRNVPTLTRVKDLSFSHHRAVTKFADAPELQKKWLDKALKHDWSAKELLRQIKLAETPQSLHGNSVGWKKYLDSLQEQLVPERWLKLPQNERREILSELQMLVTKLEEMG